MRLAMARPGDGKGATDQWFSLCRTPRFEEQERQVVQIQSNCGVLPLISAKIDFERLSDQGLRLGQPSRLHQDQGHEIERLRSPGMPLSKCGAIDLQSTAQEHLRFVQL